MDLRSRSVVVLSILTVASFVVSYVNYGNVKTLETTSKIHARDDVIVVTHPVVSHDENLFTPDRENVYEERRNIVIQGCAKFNKTISHTLDINNTVVDPIHRIFYCPIPKVSSTFWKRVFTVFTSNGGLDSPFEIRLWGAKSKSWKSLSKETQQSLQNDIDSLLFVRDPYARLFSGYENKVYQPNAPFWKSVGKKVVNIVRPGASKAVYGYDVTFPEFVKYVIYIHEHDKGINGHYSPMHKWCDPCKTQYKYIGQLETFTEDAMYLLSKWRHTYKDITLQFADLYHEAAIDSVVGHLHILWETKRVADQLKIPFIKLMLRTWRDLQIRGYLSKDIPLPYSGDVSHVTKEDFFIKIKDALNIPQNRTAVKLQRQEALVQSYRQVPLEDMERLRHFVLTDCILFGYDDRPSELFDRTTEINNDFLYLDGI